MLSHLAFHLMSMEFRLRDSLRPPIKILKEAGMHSGMTVLDFGCGPGGFSVAAARLVGRKGRVYALDIHPLAIRWIQCRAAREHLDNIQTIFGTSMTKVPGETVDFALLYDVLHDIPEPTLTLGEIHHVLKPKGVLSVSDHHLKEASLLDMVAGGGMYHLMGHTQWTFQFDKIQTRRVPR